MRGSIAVVALAALAALLVGCSEPATSDGGSVAADEGTTDGADCAKADLLRCAADSSLADLVPAKATAATGEPIVIGMVNQENTAAGSYPELSQAVDAGVAFINEQLGGVDGRPLEIEVCNTEFSTEGSTSCGQRFVDEGVPAVLGGIDVFGNAVDVLADNGIPYVGGIPVSDASVRSDHSYQWSGGSWGAAVAFADYATRELKVERVSIVYGEFGSITESAEFARKVLEARGVTVTMVPFPILATDLGSPLGVAAAARPDALFVLAADSGCQAGFDGIAALGLDVASFYLGACASPAIISAAGAKATEGAYFNVEGPVSGQRNADFDLYASVIRAYGPKGLDPVGAGTVSYRSLMNLYRVLRGIDGAPTARAIDEALAAQRGAPSYAGHVSTCDGEQFADLTAMCSPQQIVVQMEDGELVQRGDWIDVGAVYAAS